MTPFPPRTGLHQTFAEIGPARLETLPTLRERLDSYGQIQEELVRKHHTSPILEIERRLAERARVRGLKDFYDDSQFPTVSDETSLWQGNHRVHLIGSGGQLPEVTRETQRNLGIPRDTTCLTVGFLGLREVVGVKQIGVITSLSQVPDLMLDLSPRTFMKVTIDAPFRGLGIIPTDAVAGIEHNVAPEPEQAPRGIAARVRFRRARGNAPIRQIGR